MEQLKTILKTIQKLKIMFRAQQLSCSVIDKCDVDIFCDNNKWISNAIEFFHIKYLQITVKS